MAAKMPASMPMGREMAREIRFRLMVTGMREVSTSHTGVFGATATEVPQSP